MIDFYVQVLKRDLKSHYSWNTKLLHHDPTSKSWITINTAPRTLNHQSRGKIFDFENHSMEWFWADLPFSVGLAYHPISKQINYYCNIHEPIHVRHDKLEFIDLDLDVVKNKLHPEATIVDQDEFILHQKKYDYPSEFAPLIPNISFELQSRIEKDKIFKSDFVIESFRIALESKQKNGLDDPHQHFSAVNDYLTHHPWPAALQIPERLCRPIPES
jgi:protein associated with RNAse G/E